MDMQMIIDIAQTAVFALAAISAFIVYRVKQVSSIRNSSNIIMLQVKEIEENIRYIMKECIQSGMINEQQMFNSKLVYEENYWDKYHHELFKYIDYDDYNIISSFYKNASVLRKIQVDVKQFSLFSLQAKAMNYYNIIYGDGCRNPNVISYPNIMSDVSARFNAMAPKPFIPLHYGIFLSKYVGEFSPLTGTSAYEKLKKLAAKKYFFMV